MISIITGDVHYYYRSCPTEDQLAIDGKPQKLSEFKPGCYNKSSFEGLSDTFTKTFQHFCICNTDYCNGENYLTSPTSEVIASTVTRTSAEPSQEHTDPSNSTLPNNDIDNDINNGAADNKYYVTVILTVSLVTCLVND